MADDRDDLERKLERLAAPAEPPAPDGRPLDGPDALAALLAEIDGTVLPRRLTFARADGATLVLDASSRRLRRVVGAPDPTLDGRALSRDDAVAAARVLAQFLSGDGPVRVRQAPAPDDFPAQGISTSRLAEAATTAEPSPAGAFAAAAAHATGAILLSPDEEPRAAGNVDLLTAVAGDVISATRAVRRAAGPVAIAILGAAGDARLVVASAGRVESVYLTDARGAEAIAAEWRALAV